MTHCAEIKSIESPISCGDAPFIKTNISKIEIHSNRKCFDELGNYLGKISDDPNGGYIIRGRNKPTIHLKQKNF